VPWSAWLVPLVLGAVFVALLASANPLIENWLNGIDIAALAPDPGRVLFWLAAMIFAWPFIRVRAGRFRTGRFGAGWGRFAAAQPAQTRPERLAGRAGAFFGPAAILRSLLLFNALFAVQSLLDLIYLWGGAELPDGMSYATYAQRGAYPLIATALLAAGFVLAAMRPGSATERMPPVRALVYLWTGQNVLLVISAMLRLNLYVEAYSLTMLRVAALIWMMLVALGLVLIVARIALARSNAWLVSLNAAALAVTLYLSAFVNFPHLIAAYNVEHSRELSGSGLRLDTDYLVGLGPQVIPALDVFAAGRAASGHGLPAGLPEAIRGLLGEHEARMADWRSWSLRGQRLSAYLANRQDRPVAQDRAPTERGAWRYDAPANPGCGASRNGAGPAGRPCGRRTR